MKVAVVGTGYVGLVTGTCFAEVGIDVTCIDIDQKKIDNLHKGILPIYEPGLEEMVTRNVEKGRLHFSTNLAEAIKDCDVAFIAVGTPPGEDGSADLKYVLAVARGIGEHMSSYGVIVTKSTVPVGTAAKVRAEIEKALAKRGTDSSAIEFDVASNPEFLKEGAAIDDFLKPDRIVVGIDVTCIDIDQKKIDNLHQGILPIYEPGLEEMVTRNVEKGRLHFSTNLAEAIKDCDVAFIAVGTPPG